MYKSQKARTVFTTLDGIDIPFKPFSWNDYQLARQGLMQEYRDRGEQIDRPQYTVIYAGGSTRQFDHDEITILQAPKDTPPEDIARVIEAQKAQWEAWKETAIRFDKDDQDLLWDYVRNDSLAGFSLPADKAWEEKSKRRHIKIPEDPEEKLMYYLNNVLLKSNSDRIDFLATITLVSQGIVEEAHLETVKKSFRDQIWGNALKQLAGRDAPGGPENTQDGEVDGERTTDNDTNSKRVEINES